VSEFLSALNSPVRVFWRTVAVVCSAIFVLALTVPNLLVTRTSVGLQPCDVYRDYVVHCVVPGTIESAAGLRVGDRVIPASVSLAGRLAFQTYYFLHDAEKLTFQVERDGRRVPIVVSGEISSGASSIWLTLLKRGSAAVFVIIAAGLVLLRPSRMTWGFFLYALGSVNGSALFYRFLPLSIDTIFNEVLQAVYVGGSVTGLWLFATRFPSDSANGWRAAIDRAALPAGIGLALAWVAADAAFLSGVPLPAAVGTVISFLNSVGLLVGIVSLVWGYFHVIAADQRQRLKWVVAGFVGFAVANAYVNWISPYLPNNGWPAAWSAAGWTVDILAGAQILIPTTVAYAVLKHHVLDINFVLSRAVVFAVLTTIIIGVFVSAEWLIGHVLDLQRIASVVNLGIALGLGLGLNGLHKRIDSLVDSLIFRRRRLAQAQLERVAAGIAHATSSDAVDIALVDEPVNALELSSAAVFRRADDGDFNRAASIGWPSGAAEKLQPNDPLVLHMQGERGPMRLRTVIRHGDNFPKEAAAPIVAFPLLVRHQLEGLALYGLHVTGEDVDPDEIRSISNLTTQAAAAYDHLEAAALRQQVDTLATRLAALLTDRARG